MFKGLLLSFLVLFVLAGCCRIVKAQEKIEDPYLWDFGKVKEGNVVKHDFIFKNESNKNLKIEKITSSCGCIVSQAKKKILAPKENIIIEVSFKSKGYSGEVSQFVYVNTDNPDIPIVKFTIKAYVLKQQK
ncbi:MAG: DUF1573 domain-containing protein [Candidatus Omnitrophota bacterium]|nr:DUF1573 domain-containing protein [Candidatus Omnitrophota bacterium]